MAFDFWIHCLWMTYTQYVYERVVYEWHVCMYVCMYVCIWKSYLSMNVYERIVHEWHVCMCTKELFVYQCVCVCTKELFAYEWHVCMCTKELCTKELFVCEWHVSVCTKELPVNVICLCTKELLCLLFVHPWGRRVLVGAVSAGDIKRMLLNHTASSTCRHWRFLGYHMSLLAPPG